VLCVCVCISECSVLGVCISECPVLGVRGVPRAASVCVFVPGRPQWWVCVCLCLAGPSGGCVCVCAWPAPVVGVCVPACCWVDVCEGAKPSQADCEAPTIQISPHNHRESWSFHLALRN
jgi:hypothetical protein